MDSLLTSCGLAGVFLVLVAYALLSIGKIASDSAPYQWLNIVGTCGILASLIVQWNWPSVILQLAWIAIGCVSLWRIYRKKPA